MAEALQQLREEQIWKAAGDLPGIAARKFGAAVMRGARWIGSKIRAGWNWIGGKLGFKKPVAAKVPVRPQPVDEEVTMLQRGLRGAAYGIVQAAPYVGEAAKMVGKAARVATYPAVKVAKAYPRTTAAVATAAAVYAYPEVIGWGLRKLIVDPLWNRLKEGWNSAADATNTEFAKARAERDRVLNDESLPWYKKYFHPAVADQFGEAVAGGTPIPKFDM